MVQIQIIFLIRIIPNIQEKKNMQNQRSSSPEYGHQIYACQIFITTRLRKKKRQFIRRLDRVACLWNKYPIQLSLIPIIQTPKGSYMNPLHPSILRFFISFSFPFLKFFICGVLHKILHLLHPPSNSYYSMSVFFVEEFPL
jgi:hypothetical protein